MTHDETILLRMAHDLLERAEEAFQALLEARPFPEDIEKLTWELARLRQWLAHDLGLVSEEEDL